MITEHKLADVHGMGPIRVFGWASKADRIEGEKNPAHPLGRAILRGELKVKHGQSFWWLDEKFQQHACRVEHGEVPPDFEVVPLLGDAEVIITGFAEYEVKTVSGSVGSP